jgi:molybdate transport system ATP-binding protein
MIELSIRHALADLDIDIRFSSEARCLALFGDSGAGKTTILTAIAGLLRPAQGRIALNDQVLFDSASAVDMPPAQREVGYVFQDGRLFPHISVRANLLYGAQSRRRMPAQLGRLIELLELGPLLDRKPQNLSGGERQRVAIGRALASEPRILLLDEPLTGLHREARLQVLTHLRLLKQELRVATLLVSHQADEVSALADEVIRMHAGTMTAHLDIAEFSARGD